MLSMAQAPRASRDASRMIVEGEFAFTADDFRSIAKMLYADTGISLPEAKATLVYSRLGKRLRALGLNSFREYCALLATSDGSGERQHMLTSLTTNVTRFFREPHHFEHLKQEVLPALLDGARRGGRVRLWSAACSSGQEPYSIAMTILSLMPDAASFDIKILATDVDPVILAQASAGCYQDAHLEGIPPALKQRWFARSPGATEWSAADELRRLVAFRELNLIAAWPIKNQFQAIMCRNVLIYFDEETQAAVWKRFTPLIEPNGHLYIGHSERLSGASVASFDNVGITTYRRHKELRP